MQVKLVISGGDSFTFGSELHNDIINPSPSKLSWANLIAEKLNAKHINVAEGGRSNSFIARHVINKIYEALQNSKPEDIFVQVMWTFVHRQEIAVNFPTKRMDSPWFPLDPHVCEDETESDWFKELPRDTETWQGLYDGMHKRFLINKSLGLIDFSVEYYKVTGILQDTYTSLKEILMLQDFLEARNVRYMFTYVDDNVINGLKGIDKYTKGLNSFIKYDEWFNFPGVVGFNDWAKANEYEYGVYHPLEKAHEDAADIIYEEKVKHIFARESSFRKRLKELRKKDPFIYE